MEFQWYSRHNRYDEDKRPHLKSRAQKQKPCPFSTNRHLVILFFSSFFPAQLIQNCQLTLQSLVFVWKFDLSKRKQSSVPHITDLLHYFFPFIFIWLHSWCLCSSIKLHQWRDPIWGPFLAKHEAVWVQLGCCFFPWIFDFVGNFGSTPSSINVFQVWKAGTNIWSVLAYLMLDFSLFRQNACVSLIEKCNHFNKMMFLTNVSSLRGENSVLEKSCWLDSFSFKKRTFMLPVFLTHFRLKCWYFASRLSETASYKCNKAIVCWLWQAPL